MVSKQTIPYIRNFEMHKRCYIKKLKIAQLFIVQQVACDFNVRAKIPETFKRDR